MSDEERSFDFTWRLKNFSMCPEWDRTIDSPVFIVRKFANSEWKLKLDIVGSRENGFVSCVLQCVKLGIDHIFMKMEFTLSVIAGSLQLNTGETLLHDFTLNGCQGYDQWMAMRTIMRDSDNYLPGDTFTIKCSMKSLSDNIVRTEDKMIRGSSMDDLGYEGYLTGNRGCCETTIGVKTKMLLWPIEIAFLPVGDKITFPVSSFTKGMPSFVVTATRQDKSSIVFEIRKVDMTHKNTFVRCHIAAISTRELVSVLLEGEFSFAPLNNIWRYPPSLDLNLLERSGYFQTSQGVLYLQCKFSLSLEGSLDHAEYQDWEFYSPARPLPTKIFGSRDVVTVVSNYGTRASKTFTVHKTLLSENSNRFREVFANRLSADVRDVGPESLARMFQFFYTGDVGQVSVIDGTELYAAADKYKVRSLMDHCCSALKSSISLEFWRQRTFGQPLELP